MKTVSYLICNQHVRRKYISKRRKGKFRKRRRPKSKKVWIKSRLYQKEDAQDQAKILLATLKSMGTDKQLEIWTGMISNHPFDFQQLKTVHTAIEDRLRLDIISGVPYEIALYIMSFLSPDDLCRAAQTCRSWRTVCEDERLWREKCKEECLLDEWQALSDLFKKRMADSHSKQEKYVISSLSSVPKPDWKNAYLMHMHIIRNWKTRKFEISTPCISPNLSDEDQPHLMQLRCHEDSVITCLQYNPKTNIIVSGSDDLTLKVWCSETGRCLHTLEGHTGGVWSSQLSSDGTIISGSTDRTLKVWKAQTGELKHTLYGHTSTVRCLALDGKRVVSGSRDTTLRLWDIEEGECLFIFSGHSAAVRCVEFKDDTIVSGAYDHMVMVWDAVKGTCRHTLERHLNRIYSLQFDGKTIASGSLDSTICIWDASSGRLRHHLEGHQSLTSKMHLKGNLLVSANADSYCKIWDINTGQCLQTLGGDRKHTSAITSVYFNETHVVTSSDDGTVKLWDIRTGRFIRDLIVLPTASQGGVVWRIRASYTKLICAAGSRTQTEDTHLLVLDFGG